VYESLLLILTQIYKKKKIPVFKRYLSKRLINTSFALLEMTIYINFEILGVPIDFGSGHDLRVMRSSPTSGSTLGMEPA